MEELCIVCHKPAEVTCGCDDSIRLCFRDFTFNHIKTKGSHDCIDLAERRKSISQRFKSFLVYSSNIKKKILLKSTQLIHIIESITKSMLSSIQKDIIFFEKSLNKTDSHVEKLFKDYENFQFQENNLEIFADIVNKNLSKNNNDVISLNKDVENFLSKIKNDSEKLKTKEGPLMFSEILNDPKILKLKLKSEYNLYLKGHTRTVNSVTITNDNKYVISTGDDKKIIVWNLSEKRLEVVFKGHSDNIKSVAVTNDSKYIISAGYDKVIRIWNL